MCKVVSGDVDADQVGGDRAIRGHNPVADALGMQDAPILITSALCRSGVAFLELDCNSRNVGLTQAVREDAFLIALQMKACRDFDLYADGRLIRPQQFEAGSVAIFDLRSNLATDLRDPFHVVDLYLPRAALDDIADDAGLNRVAELRHQPGTAIGDPVARDLLLSMRPALAARPGETAALFVDHLALALATHVAHVYGGMRHSRPVPRGGLAAWQERRAKELLCANLNGGIALSDLARECELSIRHFTRAFRQSTGVAPHAWLVHQRLEKARGLLAMSSMAVADIAVDCGFADQSHLTRAFQRAVGMSPGAWRRMNFRPRAMTAPLQLDSENWLEDSHGRSRASITCSP